MNESFNSVLRTEAQERGAFTVTTAQWPAGHPQLSCTVLQAMALSQPFSFELFPVTREVVVAHAQLLHPI